MKNQYLASDVGSYAGVENLDLDYYCRESDGIVQTQGGLVEIAWRCDGANPIIFHNIKIRVQAKNVKPGVQPAWINGVNFRKDPADLSADSAGRGTSWMAARSPAPSNRWLEVAPVWA